MIKQLTINKNLNEAYLQVYRNKGAGGVDGVQVTELQSILQVTGQQLNEQIERGTYQVSPIKGVEIPKSNGKTRLLGIPTVVDRFYQQALHQVLQPVFEPGFRTHSYGFRPGRNAHQALQQSLENINSGYQDILDIDLKSLFIIPYFEWYSLVRLTSLVLR
jgi:RNA-directed DNA polymerase